SESSSSASSSSDSSSWENAPSSSSSSSSALPEWSPALQPTALMNKHGIYVYEINGLCNVYLDTSGVPLSFRGYRKVTILSLSLSLSLALPLPLSPSLSHTHTHTHTHGTGMKSSYLCLHECFQGATDDHLTEVLAAGVIMHSGTADN